MNELVYLKNDEAVCDSLQVAEKFGKEHKNVLQSIDNLIAENSAVKIMFKISSYKSGNGQSYRKFYMNRDGFSLLAMGFTGREALEWKLQYIRAFNQMENFIRDRIVVRRYSMDYKKEIGNLLNEIQSEKFLKFLYNVIVSFKKQWGY